MTNKIEQAANEYASFHSNVFGKCVNLEKEYAFIAGANYAIENKAKQGYHDVSSFYEDDEVTQQSPPEERDYEINLDTPVTPQKQEAVEFVDWTMTHGYKQHGDNTWSKVRPHEYMEKYLTTAEVYAKWKEGKG